MTWTLVGQIAVITLILLVAITVIQKNHWDGKCDLDLLGRYRRSKGE